MAEGILKEVEEDAMRITAKRFKDQEDERQYQLSKLEEEKSEVEDQKGTKK